MHVPMPCHALFVFNQNVRVCVSLLTCYKVLQNVQSCLAHISLAALVAVPRPCMVRTLPICVASAEQGALCFLNGWLSVASSKDCVPAGERGTDAAAVRFRSAL